MSARVLLATVGAVCAAAAGVGAGPAASAEPRAIVVGAAIGPVRLGLTEAAVRARVGAASSRRAIRFLDGRGGVAARYAAGGAPLSVVYSGGRVVWVETSSAAYRTAGGIGVGSPLAAARLPGFVPDLCEGGFTRRARGILTSFVPRGRAVARVRVVVAAFFDC